MALTPKQNRFVEEYLVDLNGSGAARRAGYSEKSACYAARRLLGLPHVAAEVKAAMEQRSVRTKVRQDEVLGQLMDIAMAEASDASGAAVKLTSKLRALELLGKHLGLFEGQGGKDGEKVTIVEDVG